MPTDASALCALYHIWQVRLRQEKLGEEPDSEDGYNNSLTNMWKSSQARRWIHGLAGLNPLVRAVGRTNVGDGKKVKDLI